MASVEKPNYSAWAKKMSAPCMNERSAACFKDRADEKSHCKLHSNEQGECKVDQALRLWVVQSMRYANRDLHTASPSKLLYLDKLITLQRAASRRTRLKKS